MIDLIIKILSKLNGYDRIDLTLVAVLLLVEMMVLVFVFWLILKRREEKLIKKNEKDLRSVVFGEGNISQDKNRFKSIKE